MPRRAFSAGAWPTLLVAMLAAASLSSAAPATTKQPATAPRVTVIADSVLTAISWNDGPLRTLMNGFDMQLQVGVCRRLTEPGCPFENDRVPSLVDVVRGLGASLGQTVVVEVGYNEPPETFAAAVEQSIAALERAGVTRILWVNLHESQPQYPEMNETLARAAQKHRTMTIVDWASYSRNRYSWFQSDGTHLVYQGAVEMATLIHTSVVQGFDPELDIVTSALPAGTVGDDYAAVLVAAGGTPPYRWRLVGAPPRGIRLLADGRIQGTPTVAGARTFTAAVTDALGVSANVRLQIVVVRAPRAAARAAA